MDALGGRTEAPEDSTLKVMTIPVSVGFDAVELVMREVLRDRPGVRWFYGNVYDEQDQPLNWWRTTERDHEDRPRSS